MRKRGWGINYIFKQCCSPFKLIAEMVKAVKDQENRESIIII